MPGDVTDKLKIQESIIRLFWAANNWLCEPSPTRANLPPPSIFTEAKTGHRAQSRGCMRMCLRSRAQKIRAKQHNLLNDINVFFNCILSGWFEFGCNHKHNHWCSDLGFLSRLQHYSTGGYDSDVTSLLHCETQEGEDHLMASSAEAISTVLCGFMTQVFPRTLRPEGMRSAYVCF